jgi:hypothetical protein
VWRTGIISANSVFGGSIAVHAIKIACPNLPCMPLLLASCRERFVVKSSVQVDDGLDLVVIINQPDMASHRDVAVVAWRSRQAASQIGRRRVHLPAQVFIQYGALMQARFLVGRQSVLAPEPCRRVGLILVVPVVRHLLVVFVKLGMGLAVLITSLCQSRTGGQDEKSYRNGTQQPICFH